MKNRKRVIKISLIIVVLTILTASLNVSHGFAALTVLGSAVGATGLIVVLSGALQVGALAIATGLNAIVAGITAVGER